MCSSDLGSFSGSRQLWTITEVDGGYTIQSVDSDRYLDLSSASTKNINTSDDPVVLLLTPQEENTYIAATAFEDGSFVFLMTII